MYIESYKQLIVWQKSIQLVKVVYESTGQLPRNEMYGLMSQMRRASISIPSNIAEGYKRKGLGEYLNFLSIADASAAELETQLIITKDLYKKVNFSEAELLLEEVQKMLVGMISKLNAKRSTLIADQSGVVVILAVLLIGIFLSIAFTLSAIFIPKLRTASDAKRSVGALYAAESALEWCLYVNRIGSTAQPVMGNGATYINGNTNVAFVESDCLASPFRSVGTYQGVTRSFEISF